MVRWEYEAFQLAKTVRSKNAGVDPHHLRHHLRSREPYERVKLQAFSPGRRSRSSTASRPSIVDFVEFDPACAIKFTITRLRPSGSPGDPDIFGSQQYAPLLDLEVPD